MKTIWKHDTTFISGDSWVTEYWLCYSRNEEVIVIMRVKKFESCQIKNKKKHMADFIISESHANSKIVPKK